MNPKETPGLPADDAGGGVLELELAGGGAAGTGGAGLPGGVLDEAPPFLDCLDLAPD